MNDSHFKHLFSAANQAANAGNIAEACEWLTQSLSYEPRSADVLGMLSGLRAQQHLPLVAQALAFVARNQAPSNSAWRQQWAKNLSTQLERVDERETQASLQAWLAVVDNAPNNTEAHLYVSNYWFQRCQFQQALPSLQQAVKFSPNSARVRMALAKCLHGLRHLEQAEPEYQAAIALEPNNLNFQWEYAMQLLLNGNFEAGWQAYESRLAINHPFESALHMYPFAYPQWQGESLNGKTILVHGEQGLGDEIMFGSLLADLQAQGATVLFAVEPGLLELFQRSFPDITCYPHRRGKNAIAYWRAGGAPEFLNDLAKLDYNVDYQCPTGSLPRHLRPTEKSFKTPAKGYLKANKKLLASYKKQLSEHAKLTKKPVSKKEANAKKSTKQQVASIKYVGLAWSGNRNTGTMGEFKSIDLALLKPLKKAADTVLKKTGIKIQFVSLHNAEYGHEASQVPELEILDFSEQLINFDQTGALIAACDWVISVDTSVCHLSAALGKETWVPLRAGADWRYVYGRDDCVWYKNMKLIRQDTDGDWQPVIKNLAKQLIERAQR